MSRPPAPSARSPLADERPRGAARRLAAATAVSAAAAILLHRWSDALPAPPLDGPGMLRWVEQEGAASAAMAILRLVALGVAGYAAFVSLIGLVGNLSRSASLARFANRASAGLVSRLAAGALTVGVATSALASGAAGAQVPAKPTVTMHLEPAPSGEPTELPGSDVPRMRLEMALTTTAPPPDLSPLEAQAAGPSSAAAPQSAAPETSAEEIAPEASTWTVRPGDHLWAIAEAAVERAGGDPADEAAVGRYWRSLVEVNRPRLADPANADLLFAGQVMVLPELPPAT